MSQRYPEMFQRLASRGEGAFIPFVMLGDPDPATSARILAELARSEADAIEVGIPFSDPVADGPVIQAAAVRALVAGTTPLHCWNLIKELRGLRPTVPIGILTYANLAFQGGPERFYQEAAASGADSVLLADLCSEEAMPFATLARAAGVAPIMIVPPNASRQRLEQLATLTEGFSYVTRRPGVTGEDSTESVSTADLIRDLHEAGAPPALLGFGVGEPSQVREALALGAAGAISGSALVRRIAAATPDRLGEVIRIFVAEMKSATRAPVGCLQRSGA